MGNPIDISGNRYGRLLVLARSGTRRGQILWACSCDCGAKVDVVSLHLRDGRTQSCGCLAREKAAATATIHGGHGSKEHSIWMGMNRRCGSPGCKSFKNYGARGITVCDSWRDSFPNFLRDMGHCPPGMSLDRKRNNEGYSPSNCRWATPKQQSRNTRRSVLLTAFGETKSMADWIEDDRCKCPVSALPQRIRAGWAHADAISTPPVTPQLRSRGHIAGAA